MQNEKDLLFAACKHNIRCNSVRAYDLLTGPMFLKFCPNIMRAVIGSSLHPYHPQVDAQRRPEPNGRGQALRRHRCCTCFKWVLNNDWEELYMRESTHCFSGKSCSFCLLFLHLWINVMFKLQSEPSIRFWIDPDLSMREHVCWEEEGRVSTAVLSWRST